MSSERCLSDFAEIIMGQSPSGEACNVLGDGIALLNGPTEFGNKHPSPVQFTTDPKRTSLSGDLLFCVRGSTTGRMNWADREYAIGRGLAAIRGKDGYPNSFIRAVIEVNLKRLLAQATGSTFPNVSRDLISALPVTSINQESAKLIASILEPLDDRIALLRETNATLEAIAKTLFKSWFVDFDPVRAKMEGRTPEGMDEATAALFPDSFEETELGQVPSGWGAQSVYESAEFINGAAYKAFEPNAERRGLPIIKIAELKSGVTLQTAYSAVKMSSKYLIETGDILFSWSGNPDTSIDMFVWAHEHAWLNQHIFRVLPNQADERSYLLQLMRHLKPVFTELARDKQTTGLGHVTVADLKRLIVVWPDIEAMRAFTEIGGCFQQRVLANEQQANLLVTLRDTLLPRLISGQLHISESSQQFEDVVA